MTTTALATVVACSSPARPRPKPTSNSLPLAAVVAAMTAARSGRVHGASLGPQGQSIAAFDGTWSGGLTGRFDVRSTIRSRDSTMVPFELRLVGNRYYVRRAAVVVATDDPVRLLTRPPGAKPWRAYRVTGGVTDAFPSAFSPLTLVAWIARLRIHTVGHGHERLAGQTVTHLTTERRTVVGPWLKSSVDLWVDASSRVVRARVMSATGGVEYDVSGFGAPVHVAPPDAAEISTTTEVVPIAPAGPFATVTSGTDAGVTWALQRARGTQGTVCWRWTASQPLPQANLSRAGQARCLPTPTPQVAPEESIQFPVIGNDPTGYDALAVALPTGVRHVTLGFVGGATKSLPIRSLLVWLGPSSPTKAYLGVVLADGTRIDCGAGAVSQIGDLTDARLTATVRGAAWGCLPPT